MARQRKSSVIVSVEEVEQCIHVIRGERVMLDSDLARFYGVSTSALNQAVHRKKYCFPPDFAFQLTSVEVTDWCSTVANFMSGHGERRRRPWVFTEEGVAMLSSVLRSNAAILVNIEIIRAFIRLRDLVGRLDAEMEWEGLLPLCLPGISSDSGDDTELAADDLGAEG